MLATQLKSTSPAGSRQAGQSLWSPGQVMLLVDSVLRGTIESLFSMLLVQLEGGIPAVLGVSTNANRSGNLMLWLA